MSFRDAAPDLNLNPGLKPHRPDTDVRANHHLFKKFAQAGPAQSI
jgi:hypothetical protein